MKLVFAGTPQFAASALAALLRAGHEIVLVLTQPDRPSGRGLRESYSPVKRLALANGLALFQPGTLKDAAVLGRIAAAVPQLLVVVAYGLILPPDALDIAPGGALNIHASLLPRWRGAAPVQRAILAGDPITGVCIMQMDAGLDTGAVLMREVMVITPEDTAGTLLEKLTVLGARLIVEAVSALDVSPDKFVVAARGGAEKREVVAAAQALDGVTYAAKIHKHEARLDWAESAQCIARKIRAFNPAPGVMTSLNGVKVKLWRAALCEGAGLPGEVLSVEAGSLRVACASGALQLLEIQRSGGKRQLVDEFVRGAVVHIGDRFETPVQVNTGNG